jgi:hypothetical protein
VSKPVISMLPSHVSHMALHFVRRDSGVFARWRRNGANRIGSQHKGPRFGAFPESKTGAEGQN